MRAIFWMTLLAVWRARTTRVVLCAMLLSLSLAWLAGSFSPRQPLTVAFDVGFSLLRAVALLMTLVWIQETVVKEIDRKTVLWVCANPIRRQDYIIGKFLAVAVVTGTSSVVMLCMLLLSVISLAPGYYQSTPMALGWPVVVLFLYLWLDLMVIQSFGFLVAALSTTSLLPLFAGAGFGIVARGLGPTLAYVRSEDSAAGGWDASLSMLQWLIPDLSRYDVRSAVLYQQWPADEILLAVPLQAIAYTALLLLLATHFFSRREFE